MTSFSMNTAWDPSVYPLFKHWLIVIDQASRLGNASTKNLLPNSFSQSTHATRSSWSSAKWQEIAAKLRTPSSTHNLILKSYSALSPSPFPQLSRWKSPKQQLQLLPMERKTAATLEGAMMENTRKRNLTKHATWSRMTCLIQFCTCFPTKHGQPILQTRTLTRSPNGMTKNVMPAPDGSSKSTASQTANTRTATLKPTKSQQTVWQAWKPGSNSANLMTIDWSGWGAAASNHYPNLPILSNQTAWGSVTAPKSISGPTQWTFCRNLPPSQSNDTPFLTPRHDDQPSNAHMTIGLTVLGEYLLCNKQNLIVRERSVWWNDSRKWKIADSHADIKDADSQHQVRQQESSTAD